PGDNWVNPPRPKTLSATKPERRLTAVPQTALRGLALGRAGQKKKRNAVAPRDGKINGMRNTIAVPVRIPMVINPFKNINAPQLTAAAELAAAAFSGDHILLSPPSFGTLRQSG